MIARELQIQLLGGFAVSIDGVPVPAERWHLRKARCLVKLLALSPGYRLHRDQVIDQLWPASDVSSAVNNFHQTLHAARTALGVDGTYCLVLEEGLLSLMGDQSGKVWVDVTEFEIAAAGARSGQDAAAYQTALAQYRGELLPEDRYEEWIIPRREILQRTYLSLLLDLARLYEHQHQYSEGIDTLQQLLATDPGCEDAHVLLMRLFALNNQRQSALRQYQVLKNALEYELETDPARETTALFRAIQSGRFPDDLSPAALGDAWGKSQSPGPLNNNLPFQLTSFIGRELEVAEVMRLLDRYRLVTLTGAGGTGKTRLALQVSSGLLEKYPDGVWLVDLSPYSDPDVVAYVVAVTLGLHEIHQQDSVNLLSSYLYRKRLLVVLDNCEHLIDACARLVLKLLQTCPQLTLLATSREVLGVNGESAYRVPSLAVPVVEKETAPVEDLIGYDAVRLFIERAQAQLPGFSPNPQELIAIAQICHRLDGIPLAIELAAARVMILSVKEIQANLDDCFRLLTGATRSTISRHRTLRASMDWSYSLLTDTERSLLQRLTVFRSGWTVAAAEAICAGDGVDREEILDLLNALVNKSMISAERQTAAGVRFRMLETIRQYALEKLGEQTTGILDQHLVYFMEWVEGLEALLKTPKAVEVLAQLDNEIDNLRAAMNWALTKNTQEGYVQELRISNALGHYWHFRAKVNEGLHWSTRGLDHSRAVDLESTRVRALACHYTGVFHFNLSHDWAKWETLMQESVDLFRQAGDPIRLAWALAKLLAFKELFYEAFHNGMTCDPQEQKAVREECFSLLAGPSFDNCPETLWDKANAYTWLGIGISVGCGEWETAFRLVREADDICRELGAQKEEIWSAIALGTFSSVYLSDYQAAYRHYLRALELSQALNDVWEMGFVLSYLSIACHFLQNFAEMQMRLEQYKNLCQDILGFWQPNHRKWYSFELGIARLNQGDVSQAADEFVESLRIRSKEAYHYCYYRDVFAFVGFAGVEACTGNLQRAIRYLGFVDCQVETRFKTPAKEDLFEYRRWLEFLHGRIDPNQFSTLWMQGRSMSFEQVLAEAHISL